MVYDWYTHLAFIVLYGFSTKIVSHKIIQIVEKPQEYKSYDELPKVDAIVVLSGGIKNKFPIKGTFYEWNDPDRFFAGIKLFKLKKSKRLIFTGGRSPLSNSTKTEGYLLYEEALSYDINAKNIIVTNEVSNTIQESRAVANVLSKFKEKTEKPSIILVTSAFHMQRAKKLFEREDITTISFPVDFKRSLENDLEIIRNPLSWIPSVSNLNKSSYFLREIIGRFFYTIF